MDRFIGEIRMALGNGAFTIALQGTMACVDICAALASDDGKTTRSHFKDWFDRHVSGSHTYLSSDDAYQLRCGMLHQGRASASRYSAVVFTLPDGRGNIFHNNIMNDVLNLDLVTFCTSVLDAAAQWWLDSKNTPHIAANAKHLVQVRPDGLAPYIVGVPVLA